jgi:hypothetical protein
VEQEIMSVREAMQANKAIGTSVAVVLFLVAGTITAYTLWPHNTHGTATGAFYTDDEGKTFFKDNIFHFPPYQQDGKTVYGALVYSSNSGQFVGALYRFRPEAKKSLEDSYAKTESGDQPMYAFKQQLGAIGRWGVEYKLVGDNGKWYGSIPRVQPPDGGDCFMVPP